ncbi:MAG: alanine dehydrogenase [Methylococcales symbiont of Hymedesmia sp. n. MRB-2018]|nr:MAG: alanine dehydrogenase [Methylococcales symbiont of Hymedesmia sp. n. MRB-2018]KAF3984448.1 MAG: alanine dehydrogenase [Methylococcales symbiont of Hymedesmia sp. n. MRB-2018]
MIIAIPREIKADEYRVSMLPVGVELLTNQGHRVLFEKNAGDGSGYADQQYVQAGAEIIEDPLQLFAKADMIVKVKEPLDAELKYMQQGQLVFTFFHFAANLALTEACLAAGITAVAYETLTDPLGRLPLLTPMSEVAGRMSIQEGAKCLEKPMEGRGILLSGVAGVEPAKVTILGAGVVGSNAAKVAAGLGANVVIMDINLDRLRYLDDMMPANVRTIYSEPHAIDCHIRTSDLIIGAVLIPGERCPVLVSREMIKNMRSGAVIVDVGVDQGGCVETTRPTTHSNPTFIVDDVVHYCVANMPGAVGRTSTQALCHATQPYILRLANGNLLEMAKQDQGIANAINMIDGKLCNAAVANAHAMHAQLIK